MNYLKKNDNKIGIKPIPIISKKEVNINNDNAKNISIFCFLSNKLSILFNMQFF